MTLLALPALAKILSTFAIILGCSRFVPLFACLYGGSVLIGLWMGLELPHIVVIIGRESTTAHSLWLSVVIVLILMLSQLLAVSGQQDRIVTSFQSISPGRRFTLVALPALIGLLPMPGGALFSAPMVESAVGEDKVKPELKVAINYWFRHVWEFCWPMYPGIILGPSLFAVAQWKIVAAQSPLTIGAIIGGLLFILPFLPELQGQPAGFSWKDFRAFLREVLPITLVITVLFGMQWVLGGMEALFSFSLAWPQYIAFTIALVVALIAVVVRNSLGGRVIGEALINPAGLRMVLTVFGVMAFKGVVVQSGSIDQVRAELIHYGIPSLAIVSLLPFIAGFVTGIAIAFVGSSFPLVVALVPEGSSPVPYAVLAYGFGFMGMMLSPIHLCLLVSNEYFSADLGAGYRYLWKPAVLVMVCTAVLFGIYRMAFP